MTKSFTPTCVWRISPELIVQLDDRFGEPVDAYVNGSQVWLRDDGPNEIVLEWRLHPVAGYQRPAGMDTYEVFENISRSLHVGETPPIAVESLWDGLETFAAYGDELEPATLAAAATEALGIAPDGTGVADHVAIGDAWEKSRGNVSIIDELLQQLSSAP